MANISAGVGRNCVNQERDVKTIKKMMNDNIVKINNFLNRNERISRFEENGNVTEDFMRAIAKFQEKVVFIRPDGAIQPRGITFSRLSELYRSISGSQIKVLLSFDDGPHALGDMEKNRTAQTLAALKNNTTQPNTKAVFFVQTHVPYRGGCTKGKKMIEKISEEGHVIGIHTGSVDDHESHVVREKNGKLTDDMKNAKTYLKELEIDARFVRPVGGKYDTRVKTIYEKSDLNLKMILWDIDSHDTTLGYSSEKIQNHLENEILDKALKGSNNIIILFHELDEDTSANNLKMYMTALKKSLNRIEYVIKFPTSKEEVLSILNNKMY